MSYVDLQDHIINEPSGQDKQLRFLYGHAWTRGIMKTLARPFFSRFVGFFMNRRFSAWFIKGFVRKNGIRMEDFEERKFRSFNDFFTRKVKGTARPVENSENTVISPCDARVSAYTVGDDLTFTVKNTVYNVKDFLKDSALAQYYEGGTLLVLRLCPDDYHRYHYLDDGSILNTYKIPGVFHTVNPIIHDYAEVYKENTREVASLMTLHFGVVTYVEVGATFVGKIVNLQKQGQMFKRGEEKGYFEFGGSTIVLLFAKDSVKIDGRFFKNTKENLETRVLYGMRLGEK